MSIFLSTNALPILYRGASDPGYLRAMQERNVNWCWSAAHFCASSKTHIEHRHAGVEEQTRPERQFSGHEVHQVFLLLCDSPLFHF